MAVHLLRCNFDKFVELTRVLAQRVNVILRESIDFEGHLTLLIAVTTNSEMNPDGVLC